MDLSSVAISSMTIHESELATGEDGPYVLYIELLRKNYGRNGLTQERLAAMSGVPRATLGRYERLCSIPEVVKDLLAVSYALGLPSLEALIAPEVREAVLEEVDQYREVRGLSRLRPGGTEAPGNHRQ